MSVPSQSVKSSPPVALVLVLWQWLHVFYAFLYKADIDPQPFVTSLPSLFFHLIPWLTFLFPQLNAELPLCDFPTKSYKYNHLKYV